jgi:hypothetical protein
VDGRIRADAVVRGLAILGADVAHREPLGQPAATRDIPEHIREQARGLAQ